MITIFKGPAYLIKGFQLIVKPKLRRFFIIPFLVNIIVFSLIFWISISQYEHLTNWLSNRLSLSSTQSSWWGHFAQTSLQYFMWIAFAIIGILVVFYTFTILANFFGSPFNGLLAEKVEEYLTGEASTSSTNIRSILASIIPSILNEIRKMAYFVFIAIIFLMFSLIPGLNVIFSVFWAFFTAWMMSLEYLGYPMENHNLQFKQVKIKASEKRLMCLSFGFSVMIITIIPILNFFAMPAAVAGATVMWVEHWRK